MPLPFLPVGLLLALAVLGGTLVLFGMALKALDWTIDASRDSAVVGIVSGLRDWRMRGEPDEAPASAPALAGATAAAPAVATLAVEMPAGPIEDSVAPVPSLERVAPERPTRRGDS